MTTWTDRRRPVLERAKEFREWWFSLEAQQWNISASEMIAMVELMHDLAAVLREGAHDLPSWCAAPIKSTTAEILAEWQAQARDPETGEKVFP